MSSGNDEVFSRLARPEVTGRTEADIQADVRMLLLDTRFNLDVPRLEEQLEDGTRRRIDIAVGATVIEVKKRLDTEEAAQGYIELASPGSSRSAGTARRCRSLPTRSFLTCWARTSPPRRRGLRRRPARPIPMSRSSNASLAWKQRCR